MKRRIVIIYLSASRHHNDERHVRTGLCAYFFITLFVFFFSLSFIME